MNIFEILNKKYVLPSKPKLFESFAGIGCQRLAFNRLGIDYESVGISEIDKYAIQSYAAIHTGFLDYRDKLLKNVTKSELKGNKLKKQLDKKASEYAKNFGSICDIKGTDLPQIDVFTWSFPCTDLSKAGKQKGLTNTRSGLVYEVLRILQECSVNGNLPKVLIMENVVDLVQSKFIREFQAIQLELEQLGYSNYTQTLNAKDYGVAQNRDRVFMVSILGEHYYEFPNPIKLEKRLKDYLENEVDPKYYLSDKMLSCFMDMTNRNGLVRGDRFNPHDLEQSKYAFAITTLAGNRATDNFIKMPEDTKQGYAQAYEGDGVYINRPHQKRGVVQDGMIQTLKTTCNSDIGVVVSSNNLTLKNIYDLCDIILLGDNIDNEKYEKSREFLRILWREITKETFWGEIGRLFDIQKEKILRQNVHEKRLFEEGLNESDLLECTYDFEKNEQPNIEEGKMRDLWFKIKHRYTPQRWGLEEQQFRKLDMFMSKLPQQTSQKEEEMYNLWRESKGFELLQQTLYSIQEIWKPIVYEKQSKGLRIRKLSPRECFRLMGIDDKDFEKAQKVNSNAQLYRQAGNGIVVDVFASIISTMQGEQK